MYMISTEMLDLSKSEHHGYRVDVKVDLESLPKAAVGEEEFYKYMERLDLAVGRDTMNRLYQALSLGTQLTHYIIITIDLWEAE